VGSSSSTLIVLVCRPGGDASVKSGESELSEPSSMTVDTMLVAEELRESSREEENVARGMTTPATMLKKKKKEVKV
jgi:hypothetical protein